jgi:hypothetical protein
LAVLDLGDDLDVSALGAEHLADVLDVLTSSDEGWLSVSKAQLIQYASRPIQAKTMSTLFLTPNTRSFLSFSDKAGRSTSYEWKN